MIKLIIKRILLIILSLVLILLLIIVIHIKKIGSIYEHNFKLIDNAKINMIFQDPLIRYYQITGDCANSLDSLFPGLSKTTIDSLKMIHYKDLLSSNDYQILQYIPLYNKDRKKNAFILISAGIDGKLNNNYNQNDTVFKNNFNTKFKLYNNFLYENQFVYKSDSIDSKFHIFQYLFGKKDYLVCYVDLTQWK